MSTDETPPVSNGLVAELVGRIEDLEAYVEKLREALDVHQAALSQHGRTIDMQSGQIGALNTGVAHIAQAVGMTARIVGDDNEAAPAEAAPGDELIEPRADEVAVHDGETVAP